jgi:hypothetical protein
MILPHLELKFPTGMIALDLLSVETRHACYRRFRIMDGFTPSSRGPAQILLC